MAQAARPVSPHLQIYRWYFTMALSIAHRVSGIAMAAFIFLFTWWLAALAAGPGAYAPVEWLLTSWLGRLVMFGYTFVLFFHMGNGVRHLVWDAGYGFDKDVARRSGQVVIAAAAALTVLTWVIYLIAR